MDLKNTINQFYFDMTINELRLMNKHYTYPNITYNSLLYLDIIAYQKNCNVSFLANAMNVAKSAVTLKVKELIHQGLVIKTQSTKDKRINYLTVKQEVIDEYKIYDDTLHKSIQMITGQYSKNDINTFCEILQFISKCYSEEQQNE